MPDAIGLLVVKCLERDLDFGIWSDLGKQTREFRYEVRVFGQDDLRVRETGATPYEAAAKATQRLEAGE